MQVQYNILISLEARTQKQQNQLPILADKSGKWEGDSSYHYNVPYYGFSVTDHYVLEENTSRDFSMEGESSEKDLLKNIENLTSEILKTPSSTTTFRNAMLSVAEMILSIAKEKSLCPDNSYSMSCDHPGFSVRTNFYVLKEKEEKPDGFATGFIWDVIVPIFVYGEHSTDYHDTVFCIKPESAVHEAMDRFLRKYSDNLRDNVTFGKIEVTRAKEMKFPYKIV